MPDNNSFHVIHIGQNGEVSTTPIATDYLDGEVAVAKGSYGAYYGRRFDNIEGNISIKSDFNRADYEWFRARTLNMTPIEQMIVAQKAYEKVGMVRNIIDMMAEFTSQGVRVEHPNPRKQRFLQSWFDYISGSLVTERLSHMLYRLGAAPIQTAYGVLSLPNENKMSMSKGGLFDEEEYQSLIVEKKKIPLKYTFIPPWNIEIMGGDLSLFIGKPMYAIKIPSTLNSQINEINKIKNKDLKQQISKIKEKITKIDKSSNYLYLEPDKFDIFFYKKDDWQVWPVPMISAILDDLMLLEKMKLSDSAALDGAISNIRHWKVGILDPQNPTNSIMPTKAGINRIRQILAMSTGGGTMDLVTGPEISFAESNTQIHKFLGNSKYESTINAIYDGLGIPPPLRSNSSSNATNNYVSMKTLIERLQYGRTIIVSFWNKQLEIVQKALGHKIPGKIVFDNMILSDESAEKKLLIELLDRDVISPDAVQKYFGFTPSLENPKINKNRKSRESGSVPPKAGPFHQSQQDFEHKKTLLQNGEVTPSELGIELKPRKNGEKPRIDKLAEQKMAALKSIPKTGKVGTKGRPKNVTETQKRKKKPNFRPQTGKGYHNLLLWANNAYNFVSEELSPIILSALGKKNFRQLTVKEFEEAENFKFYTFAQLEPLSNVTKSSILAVLQLSKSYISDIITKYQTLKSEYITENNREPTTEENRQLYIIAYIEIKFEDFLKNGV